MTRPAAFVAIALSLLCFGASACSSGTDRTHRVTRLVLAQPEEPPSLNPLLMEGASTATIVPLLYSYLLTIDDRGSLQPDIATQVPSQANKGISADGMIITYHLRKNVTWQDGTSLTARDAVFSYHAVMNPENNVPSRDGYERIRSVQAIGPYTLRVRLKAPYAPILGMFLAPNQNYGILPAHLLARYPNINHAPYNARPIGSGPYRVAEWDRGDHLRLIRNPSYYGGAPSIGEITLKFVSDTSTILNELRTGEVDMDLRADPAYLREYAAIPAVKVVRTPIAGIGDFFFNVTDPKLTDVRVRKAVAEALDLPQIVHNATRGAQTTKEANRGLFSWGYDPSIPTPAYRPSDAKQLLKAAGRPSTLQFAYVSGNAVGASVAVQVQQALRAVGITVSTRSYTPTLFVAPATDGGPIFGGKFQMAFTEILTPADPDTQWYLACSQAAPHGFNLSRFCDAPTDRAEAAGVATYDRAARRRFASIVQRRVALLLPYLALWQRNAVFVTPKELRGFRPSPESPLWNVATWTLTK